MMSTRPWSGAFENGLEATVPVRAIRGATQLEKDEREHVLTRTAELVTEVLQHNELSSDDVISVLFTATPDIQSEFPAYAARQMGLTDVPLMCARELDVAGAMPLVIRLLAHVETERSRGDVVHVYLHGAAALRRDLAHVYAAADDEVAQDGVGT